MVGWIKVKINLLTWYTSNEFESIEICCLLDLMFDRYRITN